MAEITSILPIDPITFDFQEYSISDSSLINSTTIETSFDPSTDLIEYFIYDINNNILFENVNGFPGYKLIDNNIVINPEEALKSLGYSEGQFNTLYNFVSPKLASTAGSRYFISEISPDRTEIRLDTTTIPNALVISSSLELLDSINNATGSYYDFYLDFGSNELIIANNILLDTTSATNPTILIKLYEPLPVQFNIKTECWAVTQVATSVAYNISITQTFDIIDDNIYIKGPNTNINIQDQLNNSTAYASYNNLTSTVSSQGTGSLQYQLNNLLAQTGVTINIDYSDYSNFIHFSSAQTRLENFYYKLSLLEDYNNNASLSSNTATNYYVSSSNIIYQNKINEIITTFDDYENYLYFSSGSTSWPKVNSTPPYVNVTTGSVVGLAFFTSQSLVAENYDLDNNNALINAIPSFISEDSSNAQFELFIEMIGQSFENVFVYLQDVTNKYDADNRLNYGVSKDLIADVLRDLGITIYQNNFSSNDLYQALIGLTPSGSLYNLPYTTGSLPTPTGWTYINNYVITSPTSSLVPTEDINKSQYKRIFHNLPYLLKKKGTVEGVKALITTFGIPDTILRINEFGGKDKNFNSYDNWQNEFNYAFSTISSSYISTDFTLNSAWGASNNKPQAIEFRFKTDGLPYNTSSLASQSLWETNQNVRLVLRYTGSGYTSGSYLGSIPNPYNHYAKLDFSPDPATPNTSASVYLPFYDGGWWSVLINKSNDDYTLYAKNKNYKGEDGNVIGFQASSSITSAATTWNNSTTSSFTKSPSLFCSVFTGSLQELRYYTTALPEVNFNAYVMNPYSIENSDYLAFRASLGGELYTGSTSIHPKVTGSWVTTSSFASNCNFFLDSNTYFVPNTEVFYFDQVPAGIQNAISDKIKQQNIILPYSSSISNVPNADVLSPYISIQQDYSISQSYTRDIDYVEVAFSPQNEINDDINSQIGYFNLGEVIGDPRFQSSSLDTYPDLDQIRNSYFEKYIKNYDEVDYVGLIKFFDNSLFKMVQDWIPARASVAAGIVIKQTLLERNRYRTPQVNTSASLANIGSGSTNIPYIVEDQTITGSIEIGTVKGSTGGSFTEDYYISYSSSLITLLDTPSTISQSIFLPQPGAYNIKLNISTSNNPSTSTLNGIKIYNGLGTSGDLIYQIPYNGYDPLNEGINFIANVDTQYLTFYNYAGSNTQSLQDIEIYHYPGFVSTTPSLSGSVSQILPNYYEFNGEVSGSNLVVTDGNLAKYTVITPVIYTTSSFSASYTYPSGFYLSGADQGFPRVTSSAANYVNYNFEFEKTYYLSFTATVGGTFSSEGMNLVIVNSDLSFANGVTSGSYSQQIQQGAINVQPGVNTIIDYEVTGLLPKIYFLNINGVGNNPPPYNPIVISNFVVKESVLSDPNGYVVANDVEVSRPNPKFFDVDFTQGGIYPVNYGTIITASLGSGSSTPSTVPQSNYTTARSINPRYLGCKNTSPDFNIFSGNQKPSVEQTTTMGLYYNSAGGADPELPGKTGFSIRFMFDELGTIYTPDISASYYSNLLDAFPQDSLVNIIPYSPSGSALSAVQQSLQGIKTVFWPGVTATAYLTTQSGSTSNNNFQTASLRFENLDQSGIILNNTTASYIFNTGSGDATTLSASITWGGIMAINAAYSSETFLINPIEYPQNQYYQIASTESFNNRAGFNSTTMLVLPLPYVAETSPGIFYSSPVPQFPDLVRVQNTSLKQYQYCAIESSTMYLNPFLSPDSSSIKLSTPISSSYFSGGKINNITFLRLTPVADQLLCNFSKALGNSGEGFILPNYPSPLFIKNFPEMVENFANKNLI